MTNTSDHRSADTSAQSRIKHTIRGKKSNLFPRITQIISIILLLALLTGMLGGCKKLSSLIPGLFPSDNTGTASSVDTSQRVKSDVEKFNTFMDEMFAAYAGADSISINFSCANPERYKINKIMPGTFGMASGTEASDFMKQEDAGIKERLKEFDYDKLSPEQQIVYEIIGRSIDISAIIEGIEDSFWYTGEFYPTSGLQVMLPVALSEFHFYTLEDIDIYLQLLEDTGRYVNENIEFERERSRRGYFLSTANTDEVISQCERFLENTENNLLIEAFNDRIDSFSGIFSDRREEYKQKNRELVLNSVLPAYETMLVAMRELRGTGSERGGFASFPDGEKYAAAYMRLLTGSDRSPQEVETLFMKKLSAISSRLSVLLSKKPELADRFYDGSLGQIGELTPEAYLVLLKNSITRDYPEMEPVSYTVREVHESLQEYTSPAFYMIPALDSYKDNTIYINRGAGADNLKMLTILGHEGYPGHLYQTVYFLQQSPHPIRTALEPTGYAEGWATYAEMDSYSFAGLSETEAEIMQLSNLFDLLFIARVDLGVNALGWSFEQTASYLSDYGVDDAEVVENVYQAVIGYPLQYLPYSLGYIEFMLMREEAEEALGGMFSALEFHRFLLDLGPAPFSMIRKHMLSWIDSVKSGVLKPAA